MPSSVILCETSGIVSFPLGGQIHGYRGGGMGVRGQRDGRPSAGIPTARRVGGGTTVGVAAPRQLRIVLEGVQHLCVL